MNSKNNNLGLNKRVQKKYQGIDLDKNAADVADAVGFVKKISWNAFMMIIIKRCEEAGIEFSKKDEPNYYVTGKARLRQVPLGSENKILPPISYTIYEESRVVGNYGNFCGNKVEKKFVFHVRPYNNYQRFVAEIEYSKDVEGNIVANEYLMEGPVLLDCPIYNIEELSKRGFVKGDQVLFRHNNCYEFTEAGAADVANLIIELDKISKIAEEKYKHARRVTPTSVFNLIKKNLSKEYIAEPRFYKYKFFDVVLEGENFRNLPDLSENVSLGLNKHVQKKFGEKNAEDTVEEFAELDMESFFEACARVFSPSTSKYIVSSVRGVDNHGGKWHFWFVRYVFDPSEKDSLKTWTMYIKVMDPEYLYFSGNNYNVSDLAFEAYFNPHPGDYSSFYFPMGSLASFRDYIETEIHGIGDTLTIPVKYFGISNKLTYKNLLDLKAFFEETLDGNTKNRKEVYPSLVDKGLKLTKKYKMLGESSLGLNKHVQKKFQDVDAIDNVSEYVDLDLPSGNLWCKHNYGVDEEHECGEYYTFDEAQNLGISLPSAADIEELCDETSHKIEKINGVSGMTFTSKVNGNSVFFPFAGYGFGGKINNYGHYGSYWSCEKTEEGNNGYDLSFDVAGPFVPISKLYYRCPLRTVIKPTSESSLGLNKHIQKKYNEKSEKDTIEAIGTLDPETFEKAFKEVFSKSEYVKSLDGPLKKGLHAVYRLKNQWRIQDNVFWVGLSSKGDKFSLYFVGNISTCPTIEFPIGYTCGLVKMMEEDIKDQKQRDSIRKFIYYDLVSHDLTLKNIHRALEFMEMYIEGKIPSEWYDDSCLLDWKDKINESSLGLNKHVQKKFSENDSEETAVEVGSMTFMEFFNEVIDRLNKIKEKYNEKDTVDWYPRDYTDPDNPERKHGKDSNWVSLSIEGVGRFCYKLMSVHQLYPKYVGLLEDTFNLDMSWQERPERNVYVCRNKDFGAYAWISNETCVKDPDTQKPFFKFNEKNLQESLNWIEEMIKWRRDPKVSKDKIHIDKSSNLGLNKHVQKKFQDVDAIDNISEYVDLGLPSGTLWCRHNYGAKEEYEIGVYLNHEEAVKQNTSQEHLPSRENFIELTDYCISEWTVLDNHITGRLFTSKINGQKLFFPASGEKNMKMTHGNIGYYWSSSECNKSNAYYMRFSEWHVNPQDSLSKNYEYTVRLVKNKANESNLGLNKHVQKKYEEKISKDITDSINLMDIDTFIKVACEEFNKLDIVKEAEFGSHDDRYDWYFIYIRPDNDYIKSKGYLEVFSTAYIKISDKFHNSLYAHKGETQDHPKFEMYFQLVSDISHHSFGAGNWGKKGNKKNIKQPIFDLTYKNILEAIDYFEGVVTMRIPDVWYGDYLSEANLGLNKRIQKKFEDTDKISNVTSLDYEDLTQYFLKRIKEEGYPQEIVERCFKDITNSVYSETKRHYVISNRGEDCYRVWMHVHTDKIFKNIHNYSVKCTFGVSGIKAFIVMKSDELDMHSDDYYVDRSTINHYLPPTVESVEELVGWIKEMIPPEAVRS